MADKELIATARKRMKEFKCIGCKTIIKSINPVMWCSRMCRIWHEEVSPNQTWREQIKEFWEYRKEKFKYGNKKK